MRTSSLVVAFKPDLRLALQITRFLSLLERFEASIEEVCPLSGLPENFGPSGQGSGNRLQVLITSGPSGEIFRQQFEVYSLLSLSKKL